MEATLRAVARELAHDELADYLSPWQSPAGDRSWIAMAAAADSKYTLGLLPALKASIVPTRLVWGRDDEFQTVSYASVTGVRMWPVGVP
ncbi:hypothetical protein [Crystallibacter degradans]|uniref:hypothetical protein n=1 Tax=Crystallibacter degradans TaxID=2726743 RepID=UPI00197B8BBF|nr:hypothetical protein [Arthrobacter sp. SF27]